MLGQREKSIYGNISLDSINNSLKILGKKKEVKLKFFQNASEGLLVDYILSEYTKIDFFIINAGALTHTSIALRDAFLSIDKPFYELHLSNIYKREKFRHKSYLRDIAVGVITGFGIISYELALNAALGYLAENKQTQSK